MIGINIPIRIGKATVMPGDVVLGRDGGVTFLPPQLAGQVVEYSEITHLRDLVGHQRLRERKYTAGQIDAAGCGRTSTSCRRRGRRWRRF